MSARRPALVALAAGQPLLSADYGLKASWLLRARQQGEQVPDGFCIDAVSAQQIAAGDEAACSALREQLHGLEERDGAASRLAVRASPACSLPGALLTLLDVPCDVAAVRAALQKVLESAELPAARQQLSMVGEPSRPWLGVLVQRFVPVAAANDFGAVVLTRDPASGERRLRGEYSPRGPAEVASGRGRPRPLEASQSVPPPAPPVVDGPEGDFLSAHDPAALKQIKELAQRLEATFEQPLELELCYVAGRLWLLQVRALVVSPRALVKVALDAIEEDSASYALPLLELARRGLESFTEQHFSDVSIRPEHALTRGVAASMGVAVGVVVTDVERAVERAQREPVVLLRPDAIPEDIAAFRVAKAVVTTSGGLTCHAAVIARGLGVPAVVGCHGVRIDLAGRQLWGGRDAAHVVLREGDWVSVDARKGLLYPGRLQLETRIKDADLRRLFVEIRKLRPTPLWVEGEAELALQRKEEICLDGALCSWAPKEPLPAGRGRECWVQIAATELEARVGQLPPGWGVVVTGLRDAGQLAAIRKLLPLRAIGVRLDEPTQLTGEADVRLDVLVVGAGVTLEQLTTIERRIDAARVLRVMTFPEHAPVPRGASVGWVCPAAQVAVSALRYATARVGSILDSGEGSP